MASASDNAGRRTPRSAGAGRPRLLASGVVRGKGRLGAAGAHSSGLRIQPPGGPAPLPQAGRCREEGLPHRPDRQSQDGGHGRGVVPPADEEGAESLYQTGLQPNQGGVYAGAEAHDPHAGQSVAETDRPRNGIHRLRGAEGVPGRLRGGILAGRVAHLRTEPQVGIRQAERRPDDRTDRNLLRSRTAAVSDRLGQPGCDGWATGLRRPGNPVRS